MAGDRKTLRRRVGEFAESRRAGWLSAPGAAIGLSDRDRVLGVVPIGARDGFTGAPVRKDTAFLIGSISKSVAAIVALQLAEEGLMDLHAPVTELVPWFEVRSPQGTPPITAHHLLTHTSGLITGMNFADDAVPAVWSLRGTTTGFPPGAHFRYSNDGYKVLGLMLEVAGGAPLPDLLRSRVFGPLGMTETEPVIDFATYGRLATPHQRLADDRPPHRAMPLTVSVPTPSATADGSVVSTAGDMATFARMLVCGGVHDGGRILREESFATMIHPHVPDTGTPGVAYGYGLDVFEIDERRHIGHSGGMVGHTALLWADLDGGAAAVMLSNGDAAREPVVRFALEAVRAHAAAGDLPIVPAIADPLETPIAGELSGGYVADDGAPLTLKEDHGRLVLTTDEAHATLEPLEGERFAVPVAGADRFALGVERGPGGGVVAVLHGPRRYVRAGVAPLPDPDPPLGWELLVGTYRSQNPWATCFRVFLRAGRLWLAWPDEEQVLTPLADGQWHAGDGWSPDRVRFDTVVGGRAQHAVYDAALYLRSFLD